MAQQHLHDLAQQTMLVLGRVRARGLGQAVIRSERSTRTGDRVRVRVRLARRSRAHWSGRRSWCSRMSQGKQVIASRLPPDGGTCSSSAAKLTATFPTDRQLGLTEHRQGRVKFLEPGVSLIAG
jgi:hypothetical protein